MLMKHDRTYIYSRLAAILIAVAALYSCSPVDLDFTSAPNPGRTEDAPARIPVKEYRNVFIMYSMGFNDLRGYLTEDIADVLSSPLMENGRDIILMFSHIAKSQRSWPYFDTNTPVRPTLTKISKDARGNIQKDTLLKMEENTTATSKEVLAEILTYTKENFDAETYGILFSSHGSGWAPSGYISDPEAFDPQEKDDEEDGWLVPINMSQRRRIPAYRPPGEGEIHVKTIGVHYFSLDETQEMEITDMAEAFPFKMDYMIFDACYMGGVEVAYQLRNSTEYLIASQTEILGDGMDYKNIVSYLFAEGGPDLEGFSRGYYDYYNAKSGWNRSATISLIDCSKLEPLAQSAKKIFSTYRNGLNSLQATRNVQQYYRRENEEKQKWYYDLGDIVYKCGISEEDRDEFDRCLDDAVIYKAATEYFIDTDFKMLSHSGLSMYLPFSENRDYLNTFYKTLEWNKATGLVQ